MRPACPLRSTRPPIPGQVRGCCPCRHLLQRKTPRRRIAAGHDPPLGDAGHSAVVTHLDPARSKKDIKPTNVTIASTSDVVLVNGGIRGSRRAQAVVVPRILLSRAVDTRLTVLARSSGAICVGAVQRETERTATRTNILTERRCPVGRPPFRTALFRAMVGRSQTAARSSRSHLASFVSPARSSDRTRRRPSHPSKAIGSSRCSADPSVSFAACPANGSARSTKTVMRIRDHRNGLSKLW